MKTQTNKKLPMSKNLIMGLQHVLTMVPGSIAVPLILANSLNLDAKTTAYLVAANLLTSGIAILIQVVGFKKLVGSKLPIVLGSAFAPLGPMIAIGQEFGLPVLFGSIIASGILIFLISFFLEKILKFFPDVVVGCFVLVIGLSLAPSAFSDLLGGSQSENFGSLTNICIGFSVLFVIVLLNHFGNNLIKSISLLIGLGFGFLICIPFGMINFSPVAEAAVFEPILPFHFGIPSFKIGPIIIMTLFSLINTIQCIGVYAFLDNVCDTNTDAKTQANGIRGQAVAQSIAGVFNSFPSTMFNENVAIIKLSGIKERSTIITASFMLIIMGLLPKLSAVITCIPKPVIGGVTLALFGTITAAGISILSQVDYNNNKNSLIVGTGIAVAMGCMFTSNAFDKLPSTLSMLLSNGLFMVGIVTIGLNLIFNIKKHASKNQEKKENY